MRLLTYTLIGSLFVTYFLISPTAIAQTSAEDESSKELQFEFRIGQDVINPEDGIKTSQIRGHMTIEPKLSDNSDSSMKYKVQDVEIVLASGGEARARVFQKSGNTPLHELQAAVPRAGDNMIIKISRIMLVNDEGVEERVSTRGMVFSFKVM